MKALTILVALVTASLTLAPPRVQAQMGGGGGGGEQVRAYIERNAELLDVAGALVRETNSVKARGLLDTATSLHRQSMGLMDQNSTTMAGRVAMRAREVIQQTIAVAKREARVEEQAERIMERAQARLEQARLALEETQSADPAARRLIIESSDNLRRSREQMQQHMFETSLRLAESSLALSNRAIRMLRRGGRGPDLAGEIDRTQRIIDRLSESRPGLDPALNRLAEQAIELQRRAVRSAEQGARDAAMEQTRGARSLALRALRAGGAAGPSPEEECLRAVMLTDDVIDAASGVLGDAPDEAIARRIAEAVRRQEDARHALDAGDYQKAMGLTMAARETVRNALRGMNVSPDPASVQAALEKTERVIAQLRDAMEGRDNAGAKGFLERATARQRDARRALEDGNARRALSMTRVAHNLARSGLSALDDTEN